MFVLQPRICRPSLLNPERLTTPYLDPYTLPLVVGHVFLQQKILDIKLATTTKSAVKDVTSNPSFLTPCTYAIWLAGRRGDQGEDRSH